MIKIFIEAQGPRTPEYNFIITILEVCQFDSQPCEVIALGGKDTLDLAKNQFIQNTIEGGRNLIIFDADSEVNGGGYVIRKQELTSKLDELGIAAEIFLWPDNGNDGDFETMLESIARTDLHACFFDCFHDYEACLGDNYHSPNRKGKLHTYITAMKHLTNSQRKKIGSGQWQFKDMNIWNLDSSTLTPLKEFLKSAFNKPL